MATETFPSNACSKTFSALSSSSNLSTGLPADRECTFLNVKIHEHQNQALFFRNRAENVELASLEELRYKQSRKR